MTTRPSAVAGLFYADDPDELRMQVLGLLAVVAASTKVMPKALIAPHAGYAYSGRVAAAAFATLRDSAQTITRVVLIGPAHYVPYVGSLPLRSMPSRLLLAACRSTWRRCARLPTCHLSFEPTLRIRPSTLSRWSCRSCKLYWDHSNWCHLLSAMPLHMTSPMSCDSCGPGWRR